MFCWVLHQLKSWALFFLY
uniref:Uncharacterized protein n=1 Tax=Anguilla anguilla TaxID=7936 RepID=A0A0E9VZQ7_ANGAN